MTSLQPLFCADPCGPPRRNATAMLRPCLNVVCCVQSLQISKKESRIA